MKCHSVTEKVLVGPDLREAADFQQLISLKVSAILSLQTEDDLRNREVDWEERSAAEVGLVYRNVPVTDFDPADLQTHLPGCVAVLERLLKDGHTVYVHCTAGVLAESSQLHTECPGDSAGTVAGDLAACGKLLACAWLIWKQFSDLSSQFSAPGDAVRFRTSGSTGAQWWFGCVCSEQA